MKDSRKNCVVSNHTVSLLQNPRCRVAAWLYILKNTCINDILFRTVIGTIHHTTPHMYIFSNLRDLQTKPAEYRERKSMSSTAPRVLYFFTGCSLHLVGVVSGVEACFVWCIPKCLLSLSQGFSNSISRETLHTLVLNQLSIFFSPEKVL